MNQGMKPGTTKLCSGIGGTDEKLRTVSRGLMISCPTQTQIGPSTQATHTNTTNSIKSDVARFTISSVSVTRAARGSVRDRIHPPPLIATHHECARKESKRADADAIESIDPRGWVAKQHEFHPLKINARRMPRVGGLEFAQTLGVDTARQRSHPACGDQHGAGERVAVSRGGAINSCSYAKCRIADGFYVPALGCDENLWPLNS